MEISRVMFFVNCSKYIAALAIVQNHGYGTRYKFMRLIGS